MATEVSPPPRRVATKVSLYHAVLLSQNVNQGQNVLHLSHHLLYRHNHHYLRVSGFKHPFLGLQDYYALLDPTLTERSNVIYLEVIDAVADRKDTMMGLLRSLRHFHRTEENAMVGVREGDAKLYEILKSLGYEYGEELYWLIPCPGDFHLLRIF